MNGILLLAARGDAGLMTKFQKRCEDNSLAAAMYGLAISLALLAVVLYRVLSFAYPRIWRFLKNSLGVRRTKSVLLRTAPVTESLGQAVVLGLFVLLNIILLFSHLDNANMPAAANIASRAGWLAMINLAVVVCLSLRNLGIFAVAIRSTSERLMIFHKFSGYTTLILTIIHATTYAGYFASIHLQSRLTQRTDVFGIVAGIALLLVVLVGAFVRRISYRLFHGLHVAFWLVAVVMAILHQPKLMSSVVVAPIVGVTLWGMDHMVRLFWVVLRWPNYATLRALPLGATRITLSRPLNVRSGQYIYLWVPSVRWLERHPFTVVSVEPLELVAVSRAGFTMNLLQQAISNTRSNRGQEVHLRAAIDGPYGHLPELLIWHRVMLIAGGSGASFTIGVALDLLKRITVLYGQSSVHKLVFIWYIRDQRYIYWYSKHLRTLNRDPRVYMRIYLTRDPSVQLPRPTTDATAEDNTDKNLRSHNSTVPPQKPIDRVVFRPLTTPEDTFHDVELGTPVRVRHPVETGGLPVFHERPEVAHLIQATARETRLDHRLMVMSCGPQRLMDAVRDAVAANQLMDDGPEIGLHCERFGW